MLHKNRISNIKMLSDEWHMGRLSKFTSSKIYNLIGSGALAYIRRKVGEELTGRSSEKEVDTDDTRWGALYETDAIQKFGEKMGLGFLVTQQLIYEPDSRFSSTPDGLIVTRESPDGTEYEVETVEVKCPPTFDNYIELFECETAADLKSANKIYYWQVLDQMDNCGSLVGWFVAYHPDFKAGNLKILKISANEPQETPKGKVYPIFNDLKLLREKKKWALEKFDEIRNKLMMSGRS